MDLEESLKQEKSPKMTSSYLAQFKRNPQKFKKKNTKNTSFSVVRRRSLKPITQLTKEQYKSLNNTLVKKPNTKLLYSKFEKKLEKIF